MDKRLDWLARCVARLFCLYPRRYREQYEQEMLQVFAQAAQEIYPHGLPALLVFYERELRGVLAGIFSEYWRLLFQSGGRQVYGLDGLEVNAPEKQDLRPGKSNSWTTLLAGSAIFVIWGLEAIASEIAFSSTEPWFGVFITVSHMLSWLIYLLPAVVFGYAYTRSFPRWTYAYIGSAFLYTYFMAANLIATPQVTLFGSTSGNYTRIGWRVWIPIILAMGIAFLNTRSLRPLKRFFSNAWVDWTVLSYAIFGWMPLLLIAAFDEMPSDLTLIFMPLVVTILVITATLYLASRGILQRGWVLFGGAFLSLGITLVSTEIFWSGVGTFSLPRITLIMLVFLGMMFAPALVGIYRLFYQRRAPRPV